MSVNAMIFEDAAAIVNEVMQQRTGNKRIAAISPAEYVSVGQALLKMEYDPLDTAISQVLGRTIFKIRPYNRRFGGLEADRQKWGSITRKLVAIDTPAEGPEEYKLAEGAAVDMYKVRKPKIKQLNYYGFDTYVNSKTIYRHQLENAFTDAAGLDNLISLVFRNEADKQEQQRENMARMALTNMMAAVHEKGKPRQIVKLITEYKARTGIEAITADNYRSPEYFNDFARWAYRRIADITDKMQERSRIYHFTLDSDGNESLTHTPRRDQRVYLLSDFIHDVEASTFTVNFNNSFMNVGDFERVTYWQNINSPSEINVSAARYYDKETGGVLSTEAVNLTNVIGCVFDRDAVGYTIQDEEAIRTPYNALGRYYNQFWHFTTRYWNSFDENFVILTLE